MQQDFVNRDTIIETLRRELVGPDPQGEAIECAAKVAFQEQQQILVPCRLARAEDVLDARSHGRPDFGPHIARRLSECPRMLLAERLRRVTIVVEERELRPPSHPHRITRPSPHL